MIIKGHTKQQNSGLQNFPSERSLCNGFLKDIQQQRKLKKKKTLNWPLTYTLLFIYIFLILLSQF